MQQMSLLQSEKWLVLPLLIAALHDLHLLAVHRLHLRYLQRNHRLQIERMHALRFLLLEGTVFGEDGGRVEAEVVLLGKFESGEVEVILGVVWLGKGPIVRVMLLTVVMALLGFLLFEGFGVSLGQVLGVAEQFGVHLNQNITNSTYHIHYQSYFSIIFTGGRPCHSFPRRVRPASSTNAYYLVALKWPVFVWWLLRVLPPTQKVPKMSFFICLYISSFLFTGFGCYCLENLLLEASRLLRKLDWVSDLSSAQICDFQSERRYLSFLGKYSVRYICSGLWPSCHFSLPSSVRCARELIVCSAGCLVSEGWRVGQCFLEWRGFWGEMVRLWQRLLSLEMRWSMQLEQSLMSCREDSAMVSLSSSRLIFYYCVHLSNNHEQLSGRPTSLGETLLFSPMNWRTALMVLKSLWTRVYTPCCQLPFSMQVYPQTSLLWALLQGMLLVHFCLHSGVAHRVQSEWPSGKPYAPDDSMKVQEESSSLICQLASVLVNIWMLKFRCLSTFFSFTSTDPVSPMSREDDPGNWSSWQSS